ncbi:hypothetical protein Y032_0253g267 [Ancylostoma ceylanicum]|uniref:Uncharacterized protein n=1 Tax=Ancylostoma ceylanicum TaxID=53326 RepID=A0A016SCG5_9BILA|nr:hypothetical protein Y032_0253g267 [Ancylostoma ceylanicum]
MAITVIFAALAFTVLQLINGVPVTLDGQNPTLPSEAAPCGPMTVEPITIEPPLCPICSCNPPPDCIPRKTKIVCMMACPVEPLPTS